MKAVLCKSLDGPDALEVGDLPASEPGTGEVAIRVSAVALNFFDTLIVRGKYQTKPEMPFSPGGELAGTIARVGPGVEGLSVGQRVLAYIGYNGCREEAIAPAAPRRCIARRHLRMKRPRPFPSPTAPLCTGLKIAAIFGRGRQCSSLARPEAPDSLLSRWLLA